MQLSDLQTAVRRLYGEDSTTFADNDDITEWLNDGLRELVCDAEGLRKKTTFSTVANQREYTSADVGFPADFFKPLKVYYDDLGLRLVDVRQIEDIDDAITGNPSAYYTVMYPFGLGLHPIPDTVKTVTLRYVATPTALSSDTDEPLIPSAYHRALVYFAAMQWAMSDKDLASAQAFESQWLRRRQAFMGHGMQSSAETYASVRYVEHE